MTSVLTRSAIRPMTMSTAGQIRPRYRYPGGGGALTCLQALAPDDQPGAQQDQQDGPDDVEPQPVEEAEVVEQEVDADHDQDHGPEILPAPSHGRAQSRSDRLDDLEQLRALLAGGLDELAAGHRDLDPGAIAQIARRHALQILGRRLQEAL